MILVDSSIWIEMFRRGGFKAQLGSLIANDQVCTHPCVVAELACGTLPDRQNTLRLLDHLIALRTMQLADLRVMIEARGLASKRIGLTDVHLIGSCLATPGTQIWTIDAALGRVSESLGIRASVP